MMPTIIRYALARRILVESRLQVAHFPARFDYVDKLSTAEFGPVRYPLGYPQSLGDILGYHSWDFFDVFHMHRVERSKEDDLRAVVKRLAHEGKAFVYTAHDVEPSVETDKRSYWRRVRLAATNADVVTTLTHEAARALVGALNVGELHVAVAPHGFAIEPELKVWEQSPITARGFAVFGAPRGNRHFGAVVAAWRTLPAGTRPPLRILVRSLEDVANNAESQRNASLIRFLRQQALQASDLQVDVRADFQPAEEIVSWLHAAGTLVLPYDRITHSGQLELARDVGMPVLLPDVPTLRAQLAESGDDRHPCEWFEIDNLGEPNRFAARLLATTRLVPMPAERTQEFRVRRRAEHEDVLQLHAVLYRKAVQRAQSRTGYA